MRKKSLELTFSDEKLNQLAEKYGGWPRLLDPHQQTPDAFIDELEASGYSAHSFRKLREQVGKPEREYWITLIASIVKNMQRSTGAEWHNQMLDEFLPKMREHQITDDEIKTMIASLGPD